MEGKHLVASSEFHEASPTMAIMRSRAGYDRTAPAAAAVCGVTLQLVSVDKKVISGEKHFEGRNSRRHYLA